MNTYTTEEINDLITSLTFFEYNSARYPVNVSPYMILEGKDTFGVHTTISLGNQHTWIFLDTLMSILKNAAKKVYFEDLSVSDFQLLSRVILEINLEEVPLYINDAPEISNWRLRIGK